MRASLSTFFLLLGCINIDAFTVHKSLKQHTFSPTTYATRADNDVEEDTSTKPSTKQSAGLITFDLDDTLYPIDKVIDEANESFAKAMERFGYKGVQPSAIREAAKQIRKEMPQSEAALLSFTQLRKLAIRRVMEDIAFNRKLDAMAEDFSTTVENLSKIVVEPARR